MESETQNLFFRLHPQLCLTIFEVHPEYKAAVKWGNNHGLLVLQQKRQTKISQSFPIVRFLFTSPSRGWSACRGDRNGIRRVLSLRQVPGALPLGGGGTSGT